MNSAPNRVLICDDEPQIVRALRVVLREAGYEIDHVEGKKTCTVISLQSHLMTWAEATIEAGGEAAQ